MSQRYRSIFDEAWEFYRKNRHYDAAVAFEQARHIAREGLMPDEVFQAGVWAANNWEHAGFYIKAFDLLLELLRDEPDTAPLYERWIARKRVWEILYSTNPELAKLQQRRDNLQEFWNEHPTSPKADLYHLAGILLQDQGQWAAALTQYELAWSNYDGSGNVQWEKAYRAAWCNLQLGETKATQRWCDLLGQTEMNWSQSRTDWFTLCSHLALYKGDALAAQQYAIEAEAKGDLHQHNNQDTLDVWVRTSFLQPENGDPCQPHHPAHFRLRQKPRFPLNVHGKYYRRLLLADFRLAAVRYLVGIPAVDDAWYQQPQQFPPTLPAHFQPSIFATRLKLTQRALNHARKQAEYLDHAFQCHWRQDEINQRQERLTAIIQFVQQQMR
ncbi:MAG: hypothetical protein OT477_07220 [Chloroflexi bacterium]|nr:hypothetical protein [Chloroflexota bacterium]